MNKRRLLKLADLLDADAKNKKGVRFDLSTWGSMSDPTKPLSCGTVACAMGLAVASGAFKRAGLVSGLGIHSLCPQHGDNAGLVAAESLFEIDRAASEFLFFDDAYPKNRITGAVAERYVAKRIRDFVAGKVGP